MPPQVTLCPSSLPGVVLGVFSTDWIKEGTEMGPYSGRIVRPQEIPTDRDNRFMWEVRIPFRPTSLVGIVGPGPCFTKLLSIGPNLKQLLVQATEIVPFNGLSEV